MEYICCAACTTCRWNLELQRFYVFNPLSFFFCSLDFVEDDDMMALKLNLLFTNPSNLDSKKI